MKAISLLYHDVVMPGHFDSSGFTGGDADIYKFARPEFERHLEAIFLSPCSSSRPLPERLRIRSALSLHPATRHSSLWFAQLV